jgi:hypothetical protein
MHAVGQNSQRMTQVDKLIEAVTKEIGGKVNIDFNIQKTGSTSNQYESFEHLE